MNKIKILLIAVILLSTAGLAHAKEGKQGKLGVTLDLTYKSKYLDKGIEGFGSDPGLFQTINIDLWGTGFGLGVTHQEATNSGWVDYEKFNYYVYYKNSLFDDTTYKTKYKIKWKYENYPDRPKKKKNTQEWQFKFYWPKILPIENLFPYYTAYYEYPAGSNYDNSAYTGWLHLFGLGYDLSIPELPNPLRLSAETAYRDGLGGPSTDHDWSYATLGISTKYKITDNLSFVPALYHQITMDDSTSTQGDITYVHLSMKYKF